MGVCHSCGSSLPDDQGVCSMCYGDIGHGQDGFYEERLKAALGEEIVERKKREIVVDILWQEKEEAIKTANRLEARVNELTRNLENSNRKLELAEWALESIRKYPNQALWTAVDAWEKMKAVK